MNEERTATGNTIRLLRAEFMEEAARIVENLKPFGWYDDWNSAISQAADAIRKAARS